MLCCFFFKGRSTRTPRACQRPRQTRPGSAKSDSGAGGGGGRGVGWADGVVTTEHAQLRVCLPPWLEGLLSSLSRLSVRQSPQDTMDKYQVLPSVRGQWGTGPRTSLYHNLTP